MALLDGRDFERSGMQKLGRALQGFGAGFRGKGQEFIQGQQGATTERKQALARDALAARNMLAAGDLQGTVKLLSEREDFINQLGGDPKDTIALRDRILSGDFEGSMAELNSVVGAAQDLGFLERQAQTSDLDIAKAEKLRAETKRLRGGGGVDQKQVNALRKDIFNVSKSFRLVEEANSRIKKVGKKATAASDISLIFNFMKINDPGSTVREGEFATAQNAAGVPERAVNLYNQLLKGTRLGKEQREDFLEQADSLFQGQREATDNQIGNILQQADADQIPRVRILGKERLSDFDKRLGQRSGDLSGTSDEDLLRF